MADGLSVRVRPKDDGTADVTIESVAIADLGELVARLGGPIRIPPARTTGRIRNRVDRSPTGRKLAPLWTCPRCGQKVRMQGKVSHERRHEREDREAAAAAKTK